jgi:hypothetical protein
VVHAPRAGGETVISSLAAGPWWWTVWREI